MMDLAAIFSGLRTHIPEGEIFLRLILATVFGATIGIDRELRQHPAGLRTHMLTSAAAALFTILTLELYHEVRATAGDHRATADPIRVVEAVTAGVAFLAAGAIIQGRGTVHGLTTGAGMWLAGAIGVACGTGRFTIALMAVVLALVVLSLFHAIEDRLFKAKEEREAKESNEPRAKRKPEP
jgi:putative Mg2+ transporter-C (MgtC) family protein